MNKEELQKEYQKIVLETNGGNNDYVVALCKIANAINNLDESNEQIAELQKKVKKLEYDNGELTSLIDTMRYEDPKIDELQKQLEEKDKTIQGLIEAQKYLENSASYQMFLDCQKQLEETRIDLSLARNEINTLKNNLNISQEHKKIIEEQYFEKCKQLKSQPAEIVEKINGEIYTRMVVESKETKYTDINLILDNILKQSQK